MKKIGVLAGSEAFRRFIARACPGDKIIEFKSAKDAARAALTDDYEALLLLPEAPGRLIPPFDMRAFSDILELKKRGQKLYIEKYDAGDYGARAVFGFIVDAPARGLYDEYAVYKGALLQMRGASYLPGRSSGAEVLMRVEDCLGSHAPVMPGARSFPVLVKSGSFIYSACALSCFDRLTMLPHARWRELFEDIFAPLLGAERARVGEAFDSVFAPQGLTGDVNVSTAALESAVVRALNWHLDSGVMPDRSGREGIYEMIRSMDLSVRANQRVDVIMLTAALFASAGRYFGDARMLKRGEALAEYGFGRGMQYEGGADDGLFMWFLDGDALGGSIYSSDNGRCAMALMQLYRVTGNHEYFARLKRQADMFLRWTEGEAYFKATSFSSAKYDISTLPRETPASNSPVFYEGPVLALAYLYNQTGDERYFKQVRRTADALARDYPAYKVNFSPLTRNFMLSRLIAILIAAQDIGCGDYSGLINSLIQYFRELQADSGGVRDDELVDEGKSLAHPEFAISMGKRHDCICDFLYCVNNLLGACALAEDMRRPLGVDTEAARELRAKLTRFVLCTQIRDEDCRVDGGWMRAFDITHTEYFGVNRDKDWGPYCIMGGWVMGLIPMLLLGALGEPCVYSIR